MKPTVGFLVNPIAGMGGSVGLKGTDGASVQREAVRRGARPSSDTRAASTVRALVAKGLDLRVLTCSGPMGGDVLSREGVPFEIVHKPEAASTAEDTKRAAKAFLENGAVLVLFCGGDGTARDVVDAVGPNTPVVGIPGGVKMHSSIFAIHPEEAADLVESFLRSGRTSKAEVVDVDEGAFRAGISRPRLYAVATVPDDEAHLQPTKSTYEGTDAAAEADELGGYIAESMQPGVLYIIGPGSTTEAVARAIDKDKTLLGVDAYVDREIVGRDLAEKDILRLLEEHEDRMIIVTPIGAQGFVFGRGNQQLSAQVLRAVGVDRVTVIATPTKLRSTPVLRVDTGNAELDKAFKRPFKVITARGRRKLVRVV